MSNSDEKKKVKITGAPQLTDMILGSLKPRVGKETTKWVAGLTDDAMEEAEQAARMQGVEMLTSSDQVPARPAQISITNFMDYLFDCFQQYEFEYNRSNPEIEMTMAVERPTMVQEITRPSLRAPETRNAFRGRISTRTWTLLLRGYPDSMEGWLMPIDQLISFASDQKPFTQFLAVQGTPKDDDVVWSVDGIEVTWDKMRSFAKQLFAALVHVAKTGASEDLVFTLVPKKGKPGTTAGGAPAQVDYSFDDHNPAFNEMMSYQVPGGSGAAPSQKQTSKKKAAPASNDENTAETQPAMAKPAITRSGTATAAGKASGHIEGAMEQLLTAFNQEIEALAATGQAAFAKQDMTQVEKIFQRTNKVKALHAEVSAQLEKWKSQLKD